LQPSRKHWCRESPLDCLDPQGKAVLHRQSFGYACARAIDCRKLRQALPGGGALNGADPYQQCADL
jgi:hypothetical protein